MADGCRRTMRGCGVAVAILAVGALVVQWRTTAAVDAQVAGLRAELQVFEEWAPAPRTPLEAARAGNAVIDYQVIEWVFQPRESWGEDPPGYLSQLGVARNNEQDSFQLMQAFGRLECGLDDPLRREQDLELAKPYRFLIERVRQGLHRRHCDWRYDPAAGIDAETPSFFAYRAYAGVVAIEARAHPERAVQLGAELAAFGRDVARYPNLTGLMVGAGIEQGGCQLVAASAGRADAVGAQRLVAVLEGLPPLCSERALEADRFGIEVLFAEACGEQIMTRRDSEALQKGIPALKVPRALVLSEWRAYRRTHGAMRDAARLPRAERQAASKAVVAEARAGWNVVARMAVPDLAHVTDVVEDVEAQRTLAVKTLRAGLE